MKLPSKWISPISLIVDAIFLTYCFYEGQIGLGILTSLACIMTFIDLFVMSDHKK